MRRHRDLFVQFHLTDVPEVDQTVLAGAGKYTLVVFLEPSDFADVRVLE